MDPETEMTTRGNALGEGAHALRRNDREPPLQIPADCGERLGELKRRGGVEAASVAIKKSERSWWVGWVGTPRR